MATGDTSRQSRPTSIVRFEALKKAFGRLLLGMTILAVILSLAGIIRLAFYFPAQNNVVRAAYAQLTADFGDRQPTPIDLISLSHQTCILRTDISNLRSFLQPIGTTVSSGGWCGNYVRVFVTLAKDQGYPAHRLHLRTGGRSHTLAEIYYQGKWRVVDPFFSQVWLLPNGELATYETLARNPELAMSPTPVGDPLAPRLQDIYGRYAPWFGDLFRDSDNANFKLNGPGLFHGVLWALSYPMAPFLDGERRTVHPYWIDRPEFVAMYALGAVLFLALGGLGIWQLRRARARKRDATFFDGGFTGAST